jgi:hypothetical protein
MKMLLKNSDNAIDEFLVDVHLFPSNVSQRFDIVDQEISMTAAVEFIVNLEYPSINIQVICNQLC